MFNIQLVTAMNTVNMVNSKSAVNSYNNMDGKIFVSTDMFTPERVSNRSVSSLIDRLNNIDNLSKDKNSSQSLPFMKTKTSSERRQYQPQQAETTAQTGKLLNVYA